MAFGGNRSVGLDIADTSIEVVVVGEKKKGYRVVGTARINLEPGMVEHGRIKDEARLMEAIKRLLGKVRVKSPRVVFGLPDSQVFTHVFKLGSHDKKERERLVFEEAQNHVPVKEDDLLFSYSVLEEKPNEVEILLVAVSKRVFEEWQGLFKKLDLEVMFDVEALAVFRSLYVERPQEAVGVVDLGTYASNLLIFGPRGLRFSYASKVAGHGLTNTLAEELQIPYLEAEQLKMTQGLSDVNQPAGKVLISELSGLVKDIQEGLKYFQEHTGDAVINLSLVGGGSKLPGLVEWLKPQFEIEAKLGESSLLKDKKDLDYIVATGLALRGFNRLQDQKDPVLQVKARAASKLGKNVGEVIKKQEEPEVKILNKDGKEKEKKVVLATPEELSELNKLKKQKKVLMLVVAVGVLIIMGAAWFRYDQRLRKNRGSGRWD
jgi:type IV pilus assembly protein PilM